MEVVEETLKNRFTYFHNNPMDDSLSV